MQYTYKVYRGHFLDYILVNISEPDVLVNLKIIYSVWQMIFMNIAVWGKCGNLKHNFFVSIGHGNILWCLSSMWRVDYLPEASWRQWHVGESTYNLQSKYLQNITFLSFYSLSQYILQLKGSYHIISYVSSCELQITKL